MEPSSEGFLYPVIDQKECIDCGICQKKCPVVNPVEPGEDPLIYAAWNKEEQIRRKSSSGGIFSALSKWVLDHDGVVFGAVFDSDMSVRHVPAFSDAELDPMRGSKYLQSDAGFSFQQAADFLIQGRSVLYSGTPCQIAGLKKFIKPSLQEKLIAVDFVCHGVPSGKLFKDYLQKLLTRLGADRRDLKGYSFRLLDGWGYLSRINLNGTITPLSGDLDVYLQMFLRSLLFRESCYSCPYAKTPRVGDITIADFWGIGQECPFNHKGDYGVSLVLVNNSKGRNLMQKIGNEIFFEERSLAEAVRINHQLRSPSKRPRSRNGVYDYFFAYSLASIDRKYVHTRVAKLRKMVKKLIQKMELSSN